MNDKDFNVVDFGARGDGITDDTASLQEAFIEAGKTMGQVWIPAGTYICADLQIPPFVSVKGVPSTAYSSNGASILRLRNAEAKCVLNLTGAKRTRLDGIDIDGSDQDGEGIHGVLLLPYDRKSVPGDKEDFIVIERCRIGGFSGDGIHFEKPWAYSIRSCVIARNKGCGIQNCRGSDAFILDNQLSGNGRAGFAVYDHVSSMTFTGNRIEWNGYGWPDGGNFILASGCLCNLTGNYFDRAFGPNITIMGTEQFRAGQVSITGNIIFRGGNPSRRQLKPEEMCNVRLEKASGITMTGNTLSAGQNDTDFNGRSPEYSVVIRDLENSVITGNSMHKGAISELIRDMGGHRSNVIVKENPGSIWTATNEFIWHSI